MGEALGEQSKKLKQILQRGENEMPFSKAKYRAWMCAIKCTETEEELPIHLKMAGSDNSTCRICRRKPRMTRWVFTRDPASREQPQIPGAYREGLQEPRLCRTGGWWETG